MRPRQQQKKQQLPFGSNEPPQENNPNATDEDVITTASKLQLNDQFKLCEEGGLTHTSIDDYDDKKDIDSNNVDEKELKSLRRQSSTCDYTKRSLPEDTFSFLIYASLRSPSFYLAAFVFTLQIGILVFLTVDILKTSTNPKNPMNFPSNVEFPVRIAEVLAIMIAIITQEDIRKAVSMLRDGYDQNLHKTFKEATFPKWVLSIVLRASEGLFTLFVTFLLIMRSNSVLDLLLNFLAVGFVTTLDNVVFALISEGFLGKALKKEALKLSITSYYVSHSSVDSRAACIVTVAYFVVLFTSFYAGWGIIYWKQTRGKYMCDQVYAQFGDWVVPMLGTFTGLFKQQQQQFGGRLSFRDDRDEGALLAYCQEENRWTFSVTKDNDNVSNPCNWYAASSESQDFDVLATANSQWVVKTTQNRTVPLYQHFLACYDCTDDSSCQQNGKCYSDGTCECNEGHFGLRCEYPEPCRRLEIEGKGFVKMGGSNFATTYHRLEGAETYNHPVYTSLSDNETLSNRTDILLFTGLRWILSTKHLFPGLTNVNDREGLVQYFSSFHGHFSDYAASYISEPVRLDSTRDITATPLSLTWRHHTSHSERYSYIGGEDQRLRPDLQQDFIDAAFFCGVCNNTTNPCYYGAVCLSDGSCGECPNNTWGTMCQIVKE